MLRLPDGKEIKSITKKKHLNKDLQKREKARTGMQKNIQQNSSIARAEAAAREGTQVRGKSQERTVQPHPFSIGSSCSES